MTRFAVSITPAIDTPTPVPTSWSYLGAVWRVAVGAVQDPPMADHPAVVAARAAYNRGDAVYQHTLTLSPHMGVQPSGRSLPTKADDINPVLNAVAAAGWDLVTASVVNYAGSNAIGMAYVWRRH
ncbi:hypothetical protein [Dactylosporangium sp. CA-139066]|uniref:hypothetical protein n=1 Tax=Dactylosporangium sp. CA-139066 TaxID=3239930 RepID=UPI003D9105D3